MSLRINTNVPALNALRNIGETDAGLALSIGRLSTGLRINSAADDPAGLIISENMRSQLKGLNQAVRNSQDAINMSKTAESAMDEVQRLLRDIRGIAVHSANTGVIDASALQANQTQIRSSIQSINRIAEQTSFGNKKLLNGTAGAVASVTLPGDVSSIYLGGTFNNESIASGPVTVVKVVQGVRASITLANSFADANTVVTTPGTFVINGYSFSSSGSETVQTLANKINEMSSTTGVTAQISGSGPIQIVLNQNTYGSQHKIDLVDASNVLHNASTASAVGVDAVFDVSATTTSGVQTVTFTGGRGPGESGLRISDLFGSSLVLTEAGNAGLAVPTQVGIVSSSGVMFQIGANTGQSVQFAMPAVFANRLGTNAVFGLSVADLDVTTPQGAQDAMKIIDDAINQLSQMRGELGSFQKNFLESTVRSLAVAQENLTASESQIRDVDMAMEITNYTKLQILQQSGMSVLAQANQAPQSVLQLLRGG